MVHIPDQSDWGFRFANEKPIKPIKQLIRNLEGTAANSEGEFQQLRLYAESLISEIAGEKPRLFYVRRQGQRKGKNEEIWELILASDRSDFPLPERLQNLHKTLSLQGVVNQSGKDGFEILSTRLLSLEGGVANDFALPFYLRLVPNFKHKIGVPPAVWKLITSRIPLWKKPTEERLAAWKAFL
ncbi:MAG: hypothetical protein QNJ47_04780 [Nostocaceae cyanobacterium]|nr:hypothetical protein [Nostocaceae cyanobacterium]